MTNFSLKSAFLSVALFAICSTLFAQANDSRMKIRLGFTSVNNIHRQILVTVDENSTTGIDFGYDAETFENHQDDMYWMIDDRKFLIQGLDILDQDSALPLGLHTGVDGISTILIDGLENIPETLEIVIYDNKTSTYHNIKDNSGFSIELPAGSYLDRFELRFADLTEETNSDEENNEEEEDNASEEEIIEEEVIAEIETVIEEDVTIEDIKIKLQFINRTNSIAINNPGLQKISSVEIYNLNGQLKAQYNNLQF